MKKLPSLRALMASHIPSSMLPKTPFADRRAAKEASK